jgi:large subunit ribosomal protein L22
MGKKSAERRLADNEAMAYAHNLRISPRKLGLVAGLIRGKTCEQALAELRFSKKRIARDVRKILESAIANAENNHQLDVDRLYVAEISVGRGLMMRRWRPRARGRVGRVQKPFSNLRLIVREREAPAAKQVEEKA